ALCRASGALLCGRCMRALPLIAGHRCDRCGAAAHRPVSVCAACRGRRLGYDRAVAALEYTGTARDLVHAFKDGGLRSLAAPAAAISAAAGSLRRAGAATVLAVTLARADAR